MDDKRKMILVKGIIHILNEKIKNENAELCKKNLYSEQKPLHGADMFFKLIFLEDKELTEIANACGL